MLDFTRFEILTFDCYGTLIDWETGILSALHLILSAHSKHIDDGTLLKLYGDFEQRSESGPFRPYREVLSSVVRQFGDELGFAPTAAEIRSLPDSLASWKPWPRYSRRTPSAQDSFPSRDSLQRGRRSLRLHAPQTRSRVR